MHCMLGGFLYDMEAWDSLNHEVVKCHFQCLPFISLDEDLTSKFLFPKKWKIKKGFVPPEASRLELDIQRRRRAPNLNCFLSYNEWIFRQLRLVVHDHVAVLVFDPEPPGRVAGLLPAISVDRLHRSVWILPLLVFSSVDLLLASVEVDLLCAVPLEDSEGQAECLKFPLDSLSDWLVTHRLTLMMVPSISTLSSLPSGNMFFTVWSGKVISFLPSGKCFSGAAK